jgi:hypothetical protein
MSQQQQGKCDIHGIWLDAAGECHFCKTSSPQTRSGAGVKRVGGGAIKGVKTFQKEARREE